MNYEEALQKIINHLNSSDQKYSYIEPEILSKDFVEIQIDDTKVILRIITWQEALEIDKNSYKQNNGKPYFSSEYEKRAILKIALKRIEQENENILFKFEDLSHNFLEKIWLEYKKHLHLDISEINYIYNSAKKYFDPDNNEIYPVHPFIIEVDYMTKGIVNFSRSEFAKMSLKDFECLQLILSAKNEIMKIQTK